MEELVGEFLVGFEVSLGAFGVQPFAGEVGEVGHDGGCELGDGVGVPGVVSGSGAAGCAVGGDGVADECVQGLTEPATAAEDE